MSDELEERVRALLRAPGTEPVRPGLLAEVHAGARRRRRRRAAVLAAGSVAAVLGVSLGVVLQTQGPGGGAASGPTHPSETPAASRSPRPTAAATAPGPLPRDAALGTTGLDGTAGGDVWRVSAESCGGSLCARLSRSRGNGWETLTVVESPRPASARHTGVPPVESVSVTETGRDAFAFGRQLWSTHDAGATWHRPTLDGTAQRERVDVTLEGGRAFAMQSKPFRLWESGVTQDAWREVRLPASYDFGEDLTAVDGTVGIVTYSPSTAERVLLTSHDGGITWHESKLPCTGEFGPIRTTAKAMFLHCSGNNRPGMDVWRSADGDHWRLLAHVRVATYVDDVVPVDDETVLVVTGDGGLLVTADAEKPVGLHLAQDETVLFGTFVNHDVGYLVLTPQRMLRTTDGGLTWTQVD